MAKVATEVRSERHELEAERNALKAELGDLRHLLDYSSRRDDFRVGTPQGIEKRKRRGAIDSRISAINHRLSVLDRKEAMAKEARVTAALASAGSAVERLKILVQQALLLHDEHPGDPVPLAVVQRLETRIAAAELAERRAAALAEARARQALQDPGPG